MGSEHYRLRWNNHQSNLLGVFSQLLQDESLVDVTLACAEGHSIRAHKVVLSACSSYFRTLFVDHPNRHPIVILKDVCFAELRTLVEFMYKGEVNVEYCRLSALLKTAESLKVKGLAEMTNSNSTTSTSVEQDGEDAARAAETPETAAHRKRATAAAATAASAAGETPSGTETVNKRLTNEDVDSPSPERNSSPGPPTKRPRDREDASDRERERPDAADRNDARGGCPGPADVSASVMALCQLPPSRTSPHVSEPFPGTSCLPPVQQVPLSLKKEVDWENKSTAGESSSDYRHPPDSDFSDPDLDEKYGSLCDFGTTDRRFGDGRPTTPFQLPFPPFGPFADAGESFSRQNRSLLSFLQQHGFVTTSPFEEGRSVVAAVAATANATVAAAAGSSPYRCVACSAAFPSAWLLERHNGLQHSADSRNSETGSPGEDKPFKCEQCGQSYRYRSAYSKHQEQNHRARLPADKLFTCDVCGMQFRYLKSFKKHRLNHALEKLRAKSPDGENFAAAAGTPRRDAGFEKRAGDAPESHPADSASKAFRRFASVEANGGETNESGRATAAPASAPADGGSDQVSSSNEALGDSGSPGANDGATSAPPSGKTDRGDVFESSARSYRSEEAAAAAAAATPTAIDKSAKTDRAFDSDQDETVDSLVHVLSFAGNADEIFRRRREASLVDHLLRTDSVARQRENRFSCPFCGKCVRSKENLKLHIRKHTGERPFVCLFCGRAFGGKSDLTRHLRIHTGERPYHCETCGKCFARADYLSKHLATHVHSRDSRPSFSRSDR